MEHTDFDKLVGFHPMPPDEVIGYLLELNRRGYRDGASSAWQLVSAFSLGHIYGKREERKRRRERGRE